jgi:hypothetical protein
MSDAWRGGVHNNALFCFSPKKLRLHMALCLGEIEQPRRHPQTPRQATLRVL